MPWSEFCIDCGYETPTVYFDPKQHRMRSMCSRCGGIDTRALRDEDQRRKIEAAYFERKKYEREVDNYLYGTKTVLE
jgi:hypothetical protein